MLGDRSRCNHFAVDTRLPAALPVGGIEGEQLPIARTDDHQTIARRRAARERSAGMYPPDDPAGAEIERDQIAAMSGGIDTIVSHRHPEPEAQCDRLFVIDRGVPYASHLEARVDQGSELRRLIDALVLGAGDEDHKRRKACDDSPAARSAAGVLE